jgi:hypothetical protein
MSAWADAQAASKVAKADKWTNTRRTDCLFFVKQLDRQAAEKPDVGRSQCTLVMAFAPHCFQD